MAHGPDFEHHFEIIYFKELPNGEYVVVNLQYYCYKGYELTSYLVTNKWRELNHGLFRDENCIKGDDDREFIFHSYDHPSSVLIQFYGVVKVTEQLTRIYEEQAKADDVQWISSSYYYD